MPFRETSVNVIKKKDEVFNANYIKTPYGEENPDNKANPFGLIIATEKPSESTEAEFWKMIVD